MPSTVSKTKQKSKRSLRILRNTGVKGEVVTLDIYQNDKPTMYHLFTVMEGIYRWRKAADKPDSEGYHVYFDNDQDVQCTCRAGQFGRECKHVAATRVLRERGVV